jgi:hypothetical protein
VRLLAQSNLALKHILACIFTAKQFTDRNFL